MPTTNWQPRAAKVTEVKTAVVTGYDAATTYTLTRNGKTVSSVGTGGTVATTAAALVALWEASTEPDLSEQTAANPSGGNITLTMDTSGVPSGTCSLTVSGGTGTVTDFTTTTAATGPWHVDNTANWSGGAVPTTEDVQIDLSRGSLLYGTFAAGTLASLYIFSAGQTSNTIGLPETNTNGYTEDRTKAFSKAATTCRIECQSPMIRWDFAAVANTTEVRKTGYSQTTGQPAVLLAGTSASNVCEVLDGTVGLAFFADESYAAANVRISEAGSVIQGPNGGSITTITSSGTLETNGTFGTLNQNGGESIIEGAATPTLVYVKHGTCDYRAGNPTGFRTGMGGIINCNNDLTPITCGTYTYDAGGKLLDKTQRVTISAYSRGSDVEEISAA